MRWLAILTSMLLLVACSGGGEESPPGVASYDEGIRTQGALMQQMVAVLEGVHDQASAEQAAAEIESLGRQIGQIELQMAELPLPSGQEMQAMLELQKEQSQLLQENGGVQMQKLLEYPVLQQAWMNAMQDMM